MLRHRNGEFVCRGWVFQELFHQACNPVDLALVLEVVDVQLVKSCAHETPTELPPFLALFGFK
jgi:hypothetical protein